MYEENNIRSIDLLSNEVVKNKEYIEREFTNFINEFKYQDISYFNQLHMNLTQDKRELVILLDHINMYVPDLFNELSNNPLEITEVFEDCLAEMSKESGGFTIHYKSTQNIVKIRDINSSLANRLIKIQGIVISASSVETKPKNLYLQCRTCSNVKLTKSFIPRNCDNTGCPLDPFLVISSKCDNVDSQYIKLQEFFEDVPVGETPRHFSVLLEKSLVNKVAPGNRVNILGVYSIRNQSNKNYSYIKAIGIENDSKSRKTTFTGDEEILFRELSRNNIYEKIKRSIAPGIYGRDDVKAAIACLLFGGTRRIKDDGITLRGDINILIIGDPGMGKSQILKYVEMVSPISVFTSGKGSSAAGLTASVVKNKDNEFYLEGGALVLADQGVCCIDEFDKMNLYDQVAIHEAMEQQTISIAKAGITTVLNTRTSILAAANPSFGRYDDYKGLSENVDFSSTILSRFDCVFILKDKSDKNDKTLAEHVLDLNINSNKKLKDDNIIDIDTLRNYIEYAKSRCRPTLSESALQKLSAFYVSVREQVTTYESDANSRNVVPITIRQLEALIRISESLAKMELQNIVTVTHVEEAIRIFQSSTINAVSQGHFIEGMYRPDFYSKIKNTIIKIKEVMPINVGKTFGEVVDLLKEKDEFLIKKSIDFLIKNNKIISKDHGKLLIRTP
ncbi:MCM5 [Hepatospora eriocheir]|uniref:DNA replication licensing factor MCM5 n=1 Tax=Hepatospora eriocheir TaxID=1081669 RepID=A0A1X0QAS9_9MICR|nr:MCM5 [Hepatospora eriocheir]